MGRVGRSVMRFPDAVRISAMLTKLLYRLWYGSIRSLIFGWHMSSCPGRVVGGPVIGGAKAGVSHWVGGGPGCALPNCASAAFGGTIYLWGNIARWIGMGLRAESVIPSRRQAEKTNLVPGAKSDATGLHPKNKRPLSMIAHVICAHTSPVYALQIVKHSS